MKKLISVLLVLAMVFAFAGCSNKEPAEPTIPACKEGMEHDWNITVFRKAACLETGLEKHVCKHCEYTEHVSVDALGHQFETVEGGLSICAHCGLIENPLQDATPSEDLIPIE